MQDQPYKDLQSLNNNKKKNKNNCLRKRNKGRGKGDKPRTKNISKTRIENSRFSEYKKKVRNHCDKKSPEETPNFSICAATLLLFLVLLLFGVLFGENV